ncbi:MAG: hypothetical protein QM689_02070 [Oscillospiraceae bacterium]
MNPSPELIEQSIDDLIPVLYHFAILDANDDYYEDEDAAELALCKNDDAVVRKNTANAVQGFVGGAINGWQDVSDQVLYGDHGREE